METLSVWGEFLGGVGVMLSLIFLGVQTRASNRLALAASQREQPRPFSDATRMSYMPPPPGRRRQGPTWGGTIGYHKRPMEWKCEASTSLPSWVAEEYTGELHMARVWR